MKRFLLCVVGVGAGNTTRNLAILEELRSLGDCEIRIAAQGRAQELLSRHYQTYRLQTVQYTEGESFSGLDIIRSNLGFPKRFLANMRSIGGILDEYQPDLVIADSDFYCLRPAKKKGYRLVSINNSPWVVESIRKMGGIPHGRGFSYHCIEKTDYWLQRRYPDEVLCPVLRPLRRLPPKYHQLPAFVRPGIRPLREPGDEVIVVTGGSGIDAQAIDLTSVREYPVRVFGTRLRKVPSSAVQEGFSLDLEGALQRARVLVVQGGFSSVSEAVALRVPSVVIPIRGHAEQWANARHVEALGGGLCVEDPSEAGLAVRSVLGDYRAMWTRAQRSRLPLDGARRAAGLLWEWAG